MHLRTKICFEEQARGVDYDGSYPYENYLNYFLKQAGEDLLPIPFNDTNPETGRADKRSRFEPTRTDDHTPPNPPPPPSPHRTEHTHPQPSPKTGRADTRSRKTEVEPSRTDEPSQTGAPDPQKEYRSLTKKLAQIDKFKFKAVLNPDETHKLTLEDVFKARLTKLSATHDEDYNECILDSGLPDAEHKDETNQLEIEASPGLDSPLQDSPHEDETNMQEPEAKNGLEKYRPPMRNPMREEMHSDPNPGAEVPDTRILQETKTRTDLENSGPPMRNTLREETLQDQPKRDDVQLDPQSRRRGRRRPHPELLPAGLQARR